ncbi:MAG: hypothetical protein AABY15_05895 [Nanoarchaeota archaeon]
MNIAYFQPEMSGDKNEKKADKGLISPQQVMEGAIKKAQKIEQSKNNSGLLNKNEGKLLTNDGREMMNENK